MHQQLDKQRLTCCPIAWQTQQNPTAIAVQTNTRRITFAELHDLVDHLSSQLINLGMKTGDRLVAIAENGLPLLLMQFACLRNAFIFCPINSRFSKTEIEQRLTLLNSPFIWQPSNVDNLVLDFEGTSKQANQSIPVNIDPLAIINIIFTSGSSGVPKAVMHHFSNHYYSALGSQTVIPLTTGDTNLLSLPMFHISGYATVMRTLLAGATVHISTEKINMGQLKRHHITHLSLVSSQLQQLLQDRNFQASQLSIKHLLLGGSSFPTKILEETAKRGFTYHLSYGSTEMASQIATSTNNEALQLLPYRQLKIVNNEILVAGETRFAGYFKGDSQAGLIDSGSYFASADLGELHEQAVKIIGRKDRQFISGGENIQPEEIEKILLTFAEISQAYVLPIDDPQYGQRPVAFVKWINGDRSQQLKEFIKDKLVSFKQPQHYFSLPTSQGLKPNKKQLTKLALQWQRIKQD